MTYKEAKIASVFWFILLPAIAVECVKVVKAVSSSEVISNRELSWTVWVGSLAGSSNANSQLLVSSVRSRVYVCNVSKETGCCPKIIECKR